MNHSKWRPETEDDEAQMMKDLDPAEREVLELQNAEGYEFPSAASAEEVQRFGTIAHNTMAKSERIGLRLTRAELEAIKIRAAKRRLDCHTLIASLIDQYMTGQLAPHD